MENKCRPEGQRKKEVVTKDVLGSKKLEQVNETKHMIVDDSKDVKCKSVTENQEYGIWLCDISLKDKDWYLPRKRYPLTHSYMSRFDSELKILKMPTRGDF